MEEIIFTNEVKDYLEELIFTLFIDDYFSYKENAQKYVDKIIDFTTDEINRRRHFNVPSPLKHLGQFYIFYKANNRTTWYILFERSEKRFLITSIFNNHCKEAKDLRE